MRPVAIFGPFADMAMDFLNNHFSNKFQVVKNHKDSLTKRDVYNAIKKRSKHPLLWAKVFVVSKLEQQDSFHPICIELAPKNYADISRIRSQHGYDPNYDYQMEVGDVYKQLLLTRMNIGYGTDWKNELIQTIEDEQSKNVWRIGKIIKK